MAVYQVREMFLSNGQHGIRVSFAIRDFQKIVMALIGIMIIWTTIEMIFGLGSWSRFLK